MTDGKIRESFERELENLRQVRDELRLKLHLAKADARDEFDKLERKLGEVEVELSRMGEHAKGPIAEISHASRALLDELKSGYARVRAQLKG